MINKKKTCQPTSLFWWGGVDSDHRSETQQIYSLPPLATRERSHDIKLLRKNWSWWTDSNPRPADYKSAALPTELHQRVGGVSFTAKLTISDESHFVNTFFQKKEIFF